MTRNLRKRHLIMWALVTLIVATLLIYSRKSIPQFKGDQPIQTVTK